MQIEKITPILRQLFASYQNAQVTKETVAVYVRMLQDIPPADLQTVVDQCLVECKFLPTIAEIMERHRNMHAEPTTTALDAWNELERQIRRVGYMGKPEFRDAYVAKYVRDRGWENVCASEDFMVDRAHFLKSYEAHAQIAASEARLLPEYKEMRESKRLTWHVADAPQLEVNNVDADEEGDPF